jgi:hypothetical protein
MATKRAHFRFTCKDTLTGKPMQNCLVTVKQQGTILDVPNMWSAKSGGSAVTSPFTSNAQGEVEAWADVPYQVDLTVSDNGHTAYFPGDGPSVPLTFTSFPEVDSFEYDPDDISTKDYVSINFQKKVPTGFPVQYVRVDGSDTEDGLSWGSAKKTPHIALQSLSGGQLGQMGEYGAVGGKSGDGSGYGGKGDIYLGPGKWDVHQDPTYIAGHSGATYPLWVPNATKIHGIRERASDSSGSQLNWVGDDPGLTKRTRAILNFGFPYRPTTDGSNNNSTQDRPSQATLAEFLYFTVDYTVAAYKNIGLIDFRTPTNGARLQHLFGAGFNNSTPGQAPMWAVRVVGDQYGINHHTTWAASTAYDVGDMVRPVGTNGNTVGSGTAPGGRQWVCVTAGTSGGTEPKWQQSGHGDVTNGSPNYVAQHGSAFTSDVTGMQVTVYDPDDGSVLQTGNATYVNSTTISLPSNFTSTKANAIISIRIPDGGTVKWRECAWWPGRAVAAGEVCYPTRIDSAAKNHYMVALTSGTTAVASEPGWSSSAETRLADGTVTWMVTKNNVPNYYNLIDIQVHDSGLTNFLLGAGTTSMHMEMCIIDGIMNGANASTAGCIIDWNPGGPNFGIGGFDARGFDMNLIGSKGEFSGWNTPSGAGPMAIWAKLPANLSLIGCDFEMSSGLHPTVPCIRWDDATDPPSIRMIGGHQTGWTTTRDNATGNWKYKRTSPDNTKPDVLTFLPNLGGHSTVDSTATLRTGRGATGSRPSAVTVGVGASWYDTTLAKPIFSDGTVWRDAAGTAV